MSAIAVHCISLIQQMAFELFFLFTFSFSFFTCIQYILIRDQRHYCHYHHLSYRQNSVFFKHVLAGSFIYWASIFYFNSSCLKISLNCFDMKLIWLVQELLIAFLNLDLSDEMKNFLHLLRSLTQGYHFSQRKKQLVVEELVSHLLPLVGTFRCSGSEFWTLNNNSFYWLQKYFLLRAIMWKW